MHSRMTRRARRPRDDEGVVAILMALCMVILLLVAAMVIDFGLIRVDRQVDKSAADAATVAGLHALNTGDAAPHPAVGVCTAVGFLRANAARFAGVTSASGSWQSGTNGALADGCTDAALRAQVCKPGDLSTWVKYSWAGSWAGVPLTVKIQSGYAIPSVGSPWSEDGLPAAQADVEDNAQGCDHLTVVITQHRKPGFGSLATNSDLVSAVRSVGRVKLGPGGYAPAMLLLKRTGCPVLTGGSASGSSFIHVLGSVTSNNISQPGTIHSDSDGGGCSGGSNSNVFLGKGSDGIVAYAAPLVTNHSQPDVSKPGQITSVATSDGKPMNVARDLLTNVYASNALSSGGTKTEVTGRSLVSRAGVDSRYRVTAKAAMQAATGVFTASPSSAAAATNGYAVFGAAVDKCKPTQAQVDALNLTAASRLYVDCTTNGGFVGPGSTLTINAGTIMFAGKVGPSAALSMPNAKKVYVGGSSTTALSVGNNATFQMNTLSNTDASGRCSTTKSASKAALFVKAGEINVSSGLMQLCRTTVFMMGGGPDGCVPATDGTAPTATPCAGSSGSGAVNQQATASIDWTAPDQYDNMNLANGLPNPALSPAWADADGPEDLALWAESASAFRMGGSGVFNVRGVFMAPNSDPFTIGGGSNLTLVDAQFVASSIALNGAGTFVTMSVDPNSAVTLPKLSLVGLVR